MPDTAATMVVVDAERYTTVLLTGELDRRHAPAVQHRLRDLARGRPLVLDLAGVAFIDAAGMRAIAIAAAHSAEHGAGLAVVGLRPFTAKMFRILGMHERIPLCTSTEEALACLIPPTDAQIHHWLTET
ncbi:STAS domain-containing protein [Spirillospora sp. CA-294931]|uniref:STAS domain-containing protein n=1 Tax=Spirillospora sp. CA-294931 TaxID=3240042 RepID=UPI003D8FD3BA